MEPVTPQLVALDRWWFYWHEVKISLLATSLWTETIEKFTATLPFSMEAQQSFIFSLIFVGDLGVP